MRQPTAPATIDPAPALRSLIAAIPDDRLRELVLEILLASLTMSPRATKPPAIVAKRSGGWPLGKKRGRPRKATTAKAAALAKQRQRDAALKREKRAAAAAKTGTAKPTGADPRGRRRERRRERDRARHAAKAAAAGPSVAVAAAAEAAVAKGLWTHAALLEPRAPYRALARETGINLALALDAQRAKAVPPGLDTEAVSRFLELPAA